MPGRDVIALRRAPSVRPVYTAAVSLVILRVKCGVRGAGCGESLEV